MCVKLRRIFCIRTASLYFCWLNFQVDSQKLHPYKRAFLLDAFYISTLYFAAAAPLPRSCKPARFVIYKFPSSNRSADTTHI